MMTDDSQGPCATCGGPTDYMFDGDLYPSCLGCGNLPDHCDCGYQ